MKKSALVISVLLAALCLSAVMLSVRTSAADAEDITLKSDVATEGFYNPPVVLDGQYNDYTNAYNGAVITAKNSAGIRYFYMIAETAPSDYTIEDTETGRKVTVARKGFAHELADMKALLGSIPTSVKITMPFPIAVDEIYFYSDGTLPSNVQVWKPSLEKCDILLISCHSDDDQLFFAGTLPLYATVNGCDVQVAYFTNHRFTEPARLHELLDGLWHSGIRNYPVLSEISDLYSESYEQGISVYRNAGYTEKDFTDFIKETVEACKPQVIVTHDPNNGEYGHGAHMICARSVIESAGVITEAGVSGIGTDGKWKVSKIYFHLYPDNQIVLDLDKKYDALGGKSPFTVSQEAFGFHKSQHWTWFYNWIYGYTDSRITLATEITKHSPREYGLYYSAVGDDAAKNDFMENITKLSDVVTAPPVTEAPETTASPETDEPEPPETDVTSENTTSLTETTRAETTGSDIPQDGTSRGADKTLSVVILVAAMAAVVLLLFLQYRKR